MNTAITGNIESDFLDAIKSFDSPMFPALQQPLSLVCNPAVVERYRELCLADEKRRTKRALKKKARKNRGY